MLMGLPDLAVGFCAVSIPMGSIAAMGKGHAPYGTTETTRMKNYVAMAVVAITFFLGGCSNGPKQTVVSFLDAVIAQKPYAEYIAPEAQVRAVAMYQPLSYEIKNVSDSEVSVLITFKGYISHPHQSSEDTDISETRVFTVVNGRITRIR